MGTYIRLVDIKNAGDKEVAFLEAVNNEKHELRFNDVEQSDFEKIPGSPVAYWVSERLIKCYESGTILKQTGDTRQGMATSDNGRFLRVWYEVAFSKIGFSYTNAEEASSSKKKWFPYNKGGEFRKWYGNMDFIINYENDGLEVKQYAKDLYKSATRTIKSISEYFKENISWSNPGFE